MTKREVKGRNLLKSESWVGRKHKKSRDQSNRGGSFAIERMSGRSILLVKESSITDEKKWNCKDILKKKIRRKGYWVDRLGFTQVNEEEGEQYVFANSSTFDNQWNHRLPCNNTSLWYRKHYQLRLWVKSCPWWSWSHTFVYLQWTYDFVLWELGILIRN